MNVEKDARRGARGGQGEGTDLGGGARGSGSKGNVWGGYEWARGEVDRNRNTEGRSLSYCESY